MSAWPTFHAALRARLDDEFAALVACLDASEERLRHRPAPDAWSTLEIVEHVSLTNHFLGLLAQKLVAKGKARAARGDALPAEPPPLVHLDALAERAFRWQHPEHMTPGGTLTREELAARLALQRAGFADGLAALPRGEGSLHRIRISVVEGDDRLDFYQLLHFVLLHVARHRAQIARNARAFTRASERPDT